MGRPRGWAAVVGLVVAAVLLSVVNPALLIALPLGLLLIALPPRRPGLVVLGAILTGIGLAGARLAQEPIWYLERAWALIVGAWFLVLAALLPRRSFLTRGLASLAGAGATAGAVVLAAGGWDRLDWVFTRRLEAGAARAVAFLGPRLTSGEGVGEAARIVAPAVAVYPALLGLSSLAGLALAWWAYRRLTGATARPLSRLRDFRFSDHLVWVLLVGVLLLVLPLGQDGFRAGSNVLTFMGALYALRGLAVVVALAAGAAPGALLLGGVAAVLLYPLFLGATLVVGLSDTWLDLRGRRPAARPKS